MRQFIFKLLIIILIQIFSLNKLFAQSTNDLCFNIKINDQRIDVKIKENDKILEALETSRDTINEQPYYDLVFNLLNNTTKNYFNTITKSNLSITYFVLVYKESDDSNKYIFQISSQDYILYTCQIHCLEDSGITVNNINKYSYGSLQAPKVVIETKASYIN